MTGAALAFDRRPPLMLAASDLHLGEGRNAETGVYAVRENFFADGAFGRWLAHYGGQAQQGALLVLDGDVFDFLRVMRCPTTDADFAAWAGRLAPNQRDRATRANVSDHERRYGLQTDAVKSVWKLHVIISGHPEVFDALAQWVAAGGHVVLVKGNHDLELHWPEVTLALQNDLTDRIKRLGAGDSAAAKARFRVSQEGFTLENVWVEHGHQHEAMTAVEGDAELSGRLKGQLNLPLGSFINRYFINHIERLDPFLDNVKPSTQALLAVFRRWPLTVLLTYTKAWRFVWRALKVRKRWGAVGPVLVIGAGLIAPPVVLGLIALRFFAPETMAWIPSWVRIPGSILGVSLPVILPYLLGFLRDLGRQLGYFKPGNELLEAASHVLRDEFKPGAFDRRYAVMGHTHEQGVWPVARQAGTAFYVNTGTWIALWPLDRQDLAGQVFYSFVRFTWSGARGYEHAALVWDDEAGEPRPATLLGTEEK